jgi:hypothetical protein
MLIKSDPQNCDQNRQMELKAGNDVQLEYDSEQPIFRALTEAQYGLVVQGSEIAGVRSALDGHLVQREVIGGTQIAKFHAVFSPLEKLPPEIWSEIFRASCGSTVLLLPPKPCTAPWTISQVCEMWRQIALDEPRLWNNIVVDHISNGKFRKINDLSMLEMIRTVFSRRGEFPICYEHSRGVFGTSANPIDLVVIPRLLFFRKIKLSFMASWFKTLLGLPSGCVNSLESADLALSWDWELTSEDRITLFSEARNLQHIRIFWRKSDYQDLPLYPGVLDLPWSQLTDLSLEHISLTLAMALDVLRQSLRLASWTLHLGIHPDSRPIPDNITSTTLRSFKLLSPDETFSPFLQRIQLPSLQMFHCTVSEGNISQLDISSFIKRSGCSLESFYLGGFWNQHSRVLNGTLMESLPHLVELDARFFTFPATVLKRMLRMELLPCLKYLSCSVDSPMIFVDMIEQRGLRPNSTGTDGQVPGGGIQVLKAKCIALAPCTLAFDRLYRIGHIGNRDFDLDCSRHYGIDPNDP